MASLQTHFAGYLDGMVADEGHPASHCLWKRIFSCTWDRELLTYLGYKSGLKAALEDNTDVVINSYK